MSMTAKSSVDSVRRDMIAEMLVPLPEKKEQTAIAAVIRDVTNLIDALDRIIEKKKKIKKGAMQELLEGKKRLPGFSGAWEAKKLGGEIDLLTGFPFPSNQYVPNGVRLLRGSNIKRDEIDWSEEITQHWGEVTFQLEQYLLKEGDIVIAMDGSLVGKSFARLSKQDVPALLLQRVARVRSNKIAMGYLKEWLCSEYFTKHCDSVKTVTAIPHISPDDIRDFSVLVPPTTEEQTAIAQILTDMDAEIAVLEKERDKYLAIRKGMMQQLLTGKVRLR
jgi:type I restriction enzyme S subunit